MERNDVERYRAVMNAAAIILLGLVKRSDIENPITTAVTIAIELEQKVTIDLGIKV